MRIRYFCHYGQLTGYGRAARDYLAALAFHLRHVTLERHVVEHGVNAAYDPVADPGSHELQIIDYGDLHAPHLDGRGARTVAASPEARYEHLDHLVVDARRLAELGPADVEIHHGNPRLLAQIAKGETWRALELAAPLAHTARRVGITTWETSVFPAEYATGLLDVMRVADEPCRGFDALIVPSTFCKAVLVDALEIVDPGLTSPTFDVHVLPHCFDATWWVSHPRWLERDLRPTPDTGLPVRFYTVGAAGDRKNTVGVVKAYLHAFTADDHVSMMVVGGDLNEIRAVCARSGIPADRQPPVHTVQGSIDEQTLLELHGDADCYVSATRGEGWGLGLFEAAIMGRWIITPIWGGQTDFLDPYQDGTNRVTKILSETRYPWLLDVEHQMTPCFGAEVRGEIQKDAQGRMFQSSKIAIPPGVTAKQCWAEPSLAHLAEGLIEVYKHRVALATGAAVIPDPGLEERDAGALAEVAKSFAMRYGYAAVGEAFTNLLQEIMKP